MDHRERYDAWPSPSPKEVLEEQQNREHADLYAWQDQERSKRGAMSTDETRRLDERHERERECLETCHRQERQSLLAYPPAFLAQEGGISVSVRTVSQRDLTIDLEAKERDPSGSEKSSSITLSERQGFALAEQLLKALAFAREQRIQGERSNTPKSTREKGVPKRTLDQQKQQTVERKH